MKKLLANSVSALALSAGAAFAAPPLPPADGSNSSTVEQVGTTNSATIDQGRSPGDAYLTNESYVYQGLNSTGANNNIANVTQKDNSPNNYKNDVLNKSTINQDGAWNQATVKQTGQVNDAGNNGAQNIVSITQVGNAASSANPNTMTVTQNSDDGPVLNDSTTTATVTQNVGNNNNAIVDQAGSHDTISTATVTQGGGNNNNAYVYQSRGVYGDGVTSNNLGLTQNGNGNIATVTQGGANTAHTALQTNSATIEQDVNTNTATVVQHGAGGINTVNLYQYNSLNTGTITQVSSGGSNEGDLYQHSENNNGKIDQATSVGGSQYNSASISQSLGNYNVATVKQRQGERERRGEAMSSKPGRYTAGCARGM